MSAGKMICNFRAMTLALTVSFKGINVENCDTQKANRGKTNDKPFDFGGDADHDLRTGIFKGTFTTVE